MHPQEELNKIAQHAHFGFVHFDGLGLELKYIEAPSKEGLEEQLTEWHEKGVLYAFEAKKGKVYFEVWFLVDSNSPNVDVNEIAKTIDSYFEPVKT